MILCGKILVHFNTLIKIKTHDILAQISFAPLWYISKGGAPSKNLEVQVLVWWT